MDVMYRDNTGRTLEQKRDALLEEFRLVLGELDMLEQSLVGAISGELAPGTYEPTELLRKISKAITVLEGIKKQIDDYTSSIESKKSS